MASNDPEPKPPTAFVSFATTHWTKVMAARGESEAARTALADLCECYYAPVSGFLQRRLGDRESAADLTHAFFETLLAKPGFAQLDPEKTKFRTYLLGAVKHFLSAQHRKQQRLKRGGGQDIVSLEESEELAKPQPASPEFLPDEKQFDHDWALNLMTRALSRLEQDYQSTNRTLQFNTLKPWLVGQTAALSQKEAASKLNLSEGAVKVAIHRFRKHFREIMKEEICQTLGPGDSVEDELGYLVEVLITPRR